MKGYLWRIFREGKTRLKWVMNMTSLFRITNSDLSFSLRRMEYTTAFFGRISFNTLEILGKSLASFFRIFFTEDELNWTMFPSSGILIRITF